VSSTLKKHEDIAKKALLISYDVIPANTEIQESIAINELIMLPGWIPICVGMTDKGL